MQDREWSRSVLSKSRILISCKWHFLLIKVLLNYSYTYSHAQASSSSVLLATPSKFLIDTGTVSLVNVCSRIATVREIHYCVLDCVEDLFATPTHTQNAVSAFNESRHLFTCHGRMVCSTVPKSHLLLVQSYSYKTVKNSCSYSSC